MGCSPLISNKRPSGNKTGPGPGQLAWRAGSDVGADVRPGAIYRLQLGLESVGVWDADNGGCPGCNNIKVSQCDNTLVAKVHRMIFIAFFF